MKISDNAKEGLVKIEELGIIYFYCRVHTLIYLLPKDIQFPGIGENVIKIIKYFPQKHLPKA